MWTHPHNMTDDDNFWYKNVTYWNVIEVSVSNSNVIIDRHFCALGNGGYDMLGEMLCEQTYYRF